ncbi:MAG: hypothetical protein R3F19_21430 [Verrucomicrobiales bacterium]
MVRASGDPNAASARRGVTPGRTGLLTIGDGAALAGGSLTLDSTAGTSLSPGVALNAGTVNLGSGQLSILLENPGSLPPDTSSLVLAGEALTSLQQNSANLNLLSYTSLDLYGTGALETPGSLRLSAGQIRGFNQNGGQLAIRANRLVLDNRGDATAIAAAPNVSGDLLLQADHIVLGEGNLRVDQFSLIDFDAGSGLEFEGTGSFSAQNDVTGTVAAVLAGQQANHSLRAGGILALGGNGNGSTALDAALGGVLLLEGANVSLGADVLFPSGGVTVRSTAGDLNVTGSILANGTTQRLNDLVRYTNGGEISLRAAGGNLNLAAGSIIDVSAAIGGGDAGRVTLASPTGDLNLAGTLLGSGNGIGSGGSAVIDVLELPTLSHTGSALDAGGFFASRDYRVRTGDVAIDGMSRAGSFRLAADQGSITVSGTIDASGLTGGEIVLTASGNVSTATGSHLTAAGQEFSTAGKGGTIRLEAGAQRDGIITPGALLDLQPGSSFDLGVAALVEGDQTTPGSSAFLGQSTGTLHLRAPQTADGSDLTVAAIGADIAGASSILVEGYRLYDLTSTDGTITSDVQTSIKMTAQSSEMPPTPSPAVSCQAALRIHSRPYLFSLRGGNHSPHWRPYPWQHL